MPCGCDCGEVRAGRLDGRFGEGRSEDPPEVEVLEMRGVGGSAVTLLPVDLVRVAMLGDGWGAYDSSPVCQHPRCHETWGLEGHHCVPRSRTGGPRRFVSVDGQVIRNVIWLCHVHHNDLTGMVGGHRGWLRYPEKDDGLSRRWWLWYCPSPTNRETPPALVSKTGQGWDPIGYVKES